MASQIFSQSDIDALLAGAPDAQSGEAATKRSVVDLAGIQLYDFRRPNRVSKDRLRALEAMYERLAKSLEGWLIGRLRGGVEANVQSIEQVSFGEFVLSLPSPCASFVFDVSDSGGQQGVIDLDLGFAFYVVDRLFGGTGEPVALNRALTNIERKVVRMVAERICALLVETWHDHVPLQLTLSGFDSVPEMLQAANREDPVLVANLAVRTGAQTGRIAISLPFVALEKFFSSQGNRRIKNPVVSAEERAASRVLAQELLLETPLQLSARLPEFHLSMREISALKPGAVVATGIRLDAEVEVWIGDEPRLRALPGREAGGQALALRILHPLQPAGRSGLINDEE
jgi:flagellar motor switch protein FliM